MRTLIEMLVSQVIQAIGSLRLARPSQLPDPVRDGWPTLAFTHPHSGRMTANLRSSSLRRKSFRKFLHIDRPTP